MEIIKNTNRIKSGLIEVSWVTETFSPHTYPRLSTYKIGLIERNWANLNIFSKLKKWKIARIIIVIEHNNIPPIPNPILRL